MKKHNITSVILTVLGTILVAGAVALAALWYASITSAEEKVLHTLSELQSMMPTPYNTVPDDRENKAMPSVQIDGEDFLAIVEFPTVRASLPVGSSWDKERINSHPCRFSGNVCSRDLIIGGSDNRGQLDFINEINMGDTVRVTDMTGGTYNYKITYVERSKDASRESLTKSDADLVIFARNSYALDYTVVLCSLDFQS